MTAAAEIDVLNLTSYGVKAVAVAAQMMKSTDDEEHSRGSEAF